MTFESWQAMLRDLARTDAPQVLEEARAGARARARAVLEDALVDELLAAVRSGPVRRERSARAERREPGRAPESSPNQPGKTGEAWWVYCVVRAEDGPEVVPGLAGVEPGTSVDALIEGELAALASRVPLPEYGDEQLRRHLEDITWLERTARAHEAVQESVMQRAPLVPLRLCTLYRDEQGVRSALRDKGGVFTENLAAVQGCAEWGVKVFLDHRRARPELPAEPAAQATSGADYLAGRRRERQLAAQADERCTQCAREVHGAVSALARLERVNPAQHPEVHGRDAEMLLNGAYLVEHDQAGALQETVTQLSREWAGHGLDVELTGPWPPYNFVSDSAGMIS